VQVRARDFFTAWNGNATYASARMQSNQPGFVVDVASDGTPRLRAVSRFERFLEPGVIVVAGLLALFLVISF